MPTYPDVHYRIYCYRFCKLFWFGWIESRKIHQDPLYFDDAKTILMFPESWIDYVTIGFTRYSVMKRLRKRYEKLKDIHQ